MPSTYSPLKIELPATGEQSGTWGNTTNTNLGTALEEAIVGSADVTFTNGNDTTVTLTDSNASQTARNLRLNLIGSSNAAQSLILGSGCQIEKLYLVNNTLGHDITVKNTTGTGIVVPAGKTMFVYNNGTNVVEAVNSAVTLDVTTLDATNIEVTNIKAKDGTASATIANSTGVMTVASSVLTTTDINGGTIDNTAIGASTPAAGTFTQVDIVAQGDLRLQDTTGGQFVALQAPGTIASSYTLTLPVDDGTSGQALITDGSGVLSWSTAAAGDVYGPASATDNAVARFDGTTGKIIQNSAVTIADSTGDMAGVGTLSSGAITTTGVLTVPAGTVSAPAITTTGDTNTGIFFPAADTIAFTEGGVEAMRIDSSGNVGIGVTSPSQKLEVAGNLRIKDANADSNGLNISSDSTGLGIINAGYASVGQIAFQMSGTERMRITNAGNVGIGTSSPVGKFSVVGGVIQLSAGTSAQAGLRIQNAGSVCTLVGINQDNNAYNALGFYTAGTEAVRIDTANNVGVGTSSPSERMVVAGGCLQVTGSLSALNRPSSSIFDFNTGITRIFSIGADASTHGIITFQTSTTTANAERMRIDASGNVGIGTTSPSTYGTLAVNGSLATFGVAGSLTLYRRDTNAYASALYSASGGMLWDLPTIGTAMALDTSGNLLVGTSPNGTGRLQVTDSVNYNFEVKSGGSGIVTIGGTSGTTNMAFQTNGTERMRIDSSGNVGIGTSSPSSDNRLTVSQSTTGTSSEGIRIIQTNTGQNGIALQRTGGTASYWTMYEPEGSADLRWFGGTGDRMVITSAGDVGIGTSSPSQALSLARGSGVAAFISTSANGNTPASAEVLYGQDTSSNAYVFNRANAAVIFGTNNVERMRITSGGYVGIATTPNSGFAAGSWLQISTASVIGQQANGTPNLICNAYESAGNSFNYILTAGAARYNVTAGLHIWSTAASGTAGNAITWSEQMRIDDSGNLLVGTTSSSATTSAGIKLTPNGGIPQLAIVTDTATAGNVQLSVFNLNATNNGYRFYVRADGGVYNYSANNFNLSDESEKTEITLADSYLDKLCQIPVKTFLYKDQNDNDLNLGVIAQDVEKVCPEFITKHNMGTEESPNIKLGVYETDLKYAMLKAIQEQQILINNLTTRLNALEGK
jgi:hypothetical protein